MPKGRKMTPEDAIRRLHEIQGLVNAGQTVEGACRDTGTSVKSYYAWRTKYAGRTVDEAVDAALTRRENTQLKKLVAEMALQIQVLKEVLRGKP